MSKDQVQRGPDGNWIVPIPGHSPYTFTRMKCGFDAPDSRHKVVVINLAKLLACADRDTTDYVLQAAQYWHAGKVRGICEFLAPGQERIPEVPYVTFTTRRRRTLSGLIGIASEGVVSFRNGQHRARYLAFAGASSLPVEVHETEAELLERFCGWGR